jgi:hypothetical protein
MLTTMQSGVIDTAMESVEFTELTNWFHVEPRCLLLVEDSESEPASVERGRVQHVALRHHDAGEGLELYQARATCCV